MASEASYREGSSQTPALKAFEKSHGKPGIPLLKRRNIWWWLPVLASIP
jgi:hypothetical protein